MMGRPSELHGAPARRLLTPASRFSFSMLFRFDTHLKSFETLALKSENKSWFYFMYESSL